VEGRCGEHLTQTTPASPPCCSFLSRPTRQVPVQLCSLFGCARARLGRQLGPLAFWRFASFCLGRRWWEGRRGRAEQRRLHSGGRHARCGATCSSAVGWDFRRLPPDRISHKATLGPKGHEMDGRRGYRGDSLTLIAGVFARHVVAGGFRLAEASPALLCCCLVCAPPSGALSR
jgi:hypothetical protein